MLERFQHVWSFSNMPFSVFDEKEILVQGELISTFLMACYLEEQGGGGCFIACVELHADYGGQ